MFDAWTWRVFSASEDNTRREPASPAMRRPWKALTARAASPVPIAGIVAALMLYLGSSQIWLLRFLGIASPLIVMVYGAALMGLCYAATAHIKGAVPLGRLASCLAVALVVLLLGGEGHFFYSNIDWQVRDAVLGDMIRWPWPFAYARSGAIDILRAPLGMYLLPAVIGKLWGIRAAHDALLVQNASILSGLLVLGSLLFRTARARWIGLYVVLAFSGMDIVGTALFRPERMWPLSGHIETWLPQLQYSSMVTLAFWVPQHAISGWTGALFFLLWRRGLLPLGGFLAMVPLCALWSPLGVIGTMPFACLASVQATMRREVRWIDIGVPLGMSLLAGVSLIYLELDASKVGARIDPIGFLAFAVFEGIEVWPILGLVALLGGLKSYGRTAFFTVATCLAILPFVAIGEGGDFVMRASICPLLILAVIAAEQVAETPLGLRKMLLMLVLAVGCVTPLREIYRAIVYLPSPYTTCDVAASARESFPVSMNTYFARASSLPSPLQIIPTRIAPPTRGACYPRKWSVPRWSSIQRSAPPKSIIPADSGH